MFFLTRPMSTCLPPPPAKKHRNGDFDVQRRLNWSMLAPFPALFSRYLREMTTKERRGGFLHTLLRLSVLREVVGPPPVGAKSDRETAGGGHLKSAFVLPARPVTPHPLRPQSDMSFRLSLS